PTTVVLGERKRRDRLAARDAGEQLLAGGVVARVEDRVGRQRDRREVRRAQEGAAHLLEDDDELDIGEARAAVLLGDGQALEPELLGHLAPYGRVEALLGLHQPADLRRRRLVLEEAADGAPELLLLFAEGEVHTRVPSVGRGSRGSPS